MNHVQKCLQAITYDGGGIRKAWLMARASYAYTRAHDGAVINDQGDTISFSRWYAFTGAAETFWRHLWKK